MTSNLSTDTGQRHDTIAAAVLAAFVGLAGVAALLGRVVNATGHPVTTAVSLVITVLVIGAARWVTRRVRERREDADDALAGAAWRAEHLPHLAAQITMRIERNGAGVA
jgi:hypothetical protein